MISVSHPDAKVWARWLYLRSLNRCENLTWHSWTPLYSPCHVMFMGICFHMFNWPFANRGCIGLYLLALHHVWLLAQIARILTLPTFPGIQVYLS